MFYRASGNSQAEFVASLVQNGVIKKGTRTFDVISRLDRTKYGGAWNDSPQPIGYGQTVSAPHMHAMCLDLLGQHLKPGGRALDVGSGSGYLTAAMGLMVRGEGGRVIGIEAVPQLVAHGNNALQNDVPELLADGTVEIKLGDGWKGDPDNGPYDCIHVGAAAVSIPEPLKEQLSPKGGTLVIPVGPDGGGTEWGFVYAKNHHWRAVRATGEAIIKIGEAMSSLQNK